MGIGAFLYCSADLFVNVHLPGTMFQDKSLNVKFTIFVYVGNKGRSRC